MTEVEYLVVVAQIILINALSWVSAHIEPLRLKRWLLRGSIAVVLVTVAFLTDVFFGNSASRLMLWVTGILILDAVFAILLFRSLFHRGISEHG